MKKSAMAYTIKVKNSENDDDSLLFSLTENEFSLLDLRSAFSSANSLRYKDKGDVNYHHVICRDGIFREPIGGWGYEGREYVAVCSFQGAQGGSRYTQFQNFRRQISTKQSTSRSRRDTQPENDDSSAVNRKESPTTMISVGIGRFSASGKFSRISSVNLSSIGGIVAVGPISKTDETRHKIKEEAFKKFTSVNQFFRRTYKSADDFILVYPDGTEVNRLPDNTTNFTISGYRNYLDPRRRYDRLRLYLCLKDNYNQANIEILTDSSSDEDLPTFEITTRRNKDSERIYIAAPTTPSLSSGEESPNEILPGSSASADDTIPFSETPPFAESPPLVVECHFNIQGRLLKESFPCNAPAKHLIAYVAQHCSTDEFTLTTNNREIAYDCRLSDLTATSNVLEVTAKMSETKAGPIPAEYHWNKHDDVQLIVNKALEKLGHAEEPTLILKRYQETFLEGRQLECQSCDETIEGETSEIYIGRYTLWEDTVSEIPNLPNLRFPIDVVFYGEESSDFGGPRREYFRLAMKEIKERIINGEDLSSTKLNSTSNLIATHGYYVAGLLIGLSAIENGPCADFLDSLIQNWSEEKEEYIMIKKGLSRTGLWQMLEAKPTLRYLFRKKNSKLSVNKLMSLLKPSFSEEGSTRRQQEERTYSSFIRYVRQAAAGRQVVTIEGILRFVTGCDDEPVLGFQMGPSIEFAETPGHFPTASTCVNSLILPINHGQSEEELFDKFSLAFANEYFGLQ